jgi:hypothetical protein
MSDESGGKTDYVILRLPKAAEHEYACKEAKAYADLFKQRREHPMSVEMAAALIERAFLAGWDAKAKTVVSWKNKKSAEPAIQWRKKDDRWFGYATKNSRMQFKIVNENGLGFDVYCNMHAPSSDERCIATGIQTIEHAKEECDMVVAAMGP